MPSVRGSFRGAARRPYVDAQIVLPRFGVTTRVPFIVDTGADTTIIHWNDRRRLLAPDGRPLAADASFQGDVEATGIAGARVEYGSEDAALVFDTEEGGRLLARVRVHIELGRSARPVPSLLGRDLLSELRLDFNMPADDLVLEWAS